MSDKAPEKHAFSRRLGGILMRVRPAPLAVAIKTFLRIRRIEVETVEGKFWLDPASEFGQRVLKDGVYEPETVRTLKRILLSGGTFADIGANEGYFSVVASRIVGPSGRVLTVEPQDRLQGVLLRNFALNGAANITIVAAVVSDSQGVAELHLSPSMNTGASSLAQRRCYAPQRKAVPMRTLAEIIDESGIGRVDLLKMDIEGWEYEAILGSRSLFENGQIRALCLELHAEHLRARGLDIKPIVDFLLGCGYRHAADFDTLVFLHRDFPV